jgi:hypothetical protein
MAGRMLRTVLGLLFVCIASSAFAQSPQPTKKAAAAPAHTKSALPEAASTSGKFGPSICITSIVGHRFEVQTIGLTVFGNALQPVDTTAWGLDDLIIRKIGAIASNHFVVRRIALSRSTIDSFSAPKKSIFEGGSLFRDSAKESLDILKTAAGTTGKCDFYLEIFRQSSGYGNTNQFLNGIGILNHDTGILSAQYLFAILSASLYDGKASELRKTELLRTGPAIDFGEALTGPGIHGLYRRVDKTWLPNPPQTAAQNVRLRDATWALIEPGLANTIPAMLVPQ